MVVSPSFTAVTVGVRSLPLYAALVALSVIVGEVTTFGAMVNVAVAVPV